jgi:hypothetical protein
MDEFVVWLGVQFCLFAILGNVKELESMFPSILRIKYNHRNITILAAILDLSVNDGLIV